MSLIQLFFVFFYIGLFAIGGGLVAASFMQQILVVKYGLISASKFYSMLAISESTPGPIGINIATYIGNEMYGVPGGIICTFGEVLPSIIVIIIVARYFKKMNEKPLVKSIFFALRPVTTGMVFAVFVQIFTLCILQIEKFKIDYDWRVLFNWKALILYFACLPVLFKTKLHPVFLILAGGIFGVLFL